MVIRITVRGIGQRKWNLDKCIACGGKGRQKLTNDQAAEWGYDSVVCPECDGKGHKKSVTYFNKLGDTGNISFNDSGYSRV